MKFDYNKFKTIQEKKIRLELKKLLKNKALPLQEVFDYFDYQTKFSANFVTDLLLNNQNGGERCVSIWVFAN